MCYGIALLMQKLVLNKCINVIVAWGLIFYSSEGSFDVVALNFCRCEVGIQELPRNSALGRLRGSDNVVSFCKIDEQCSTIDGIIVFGLDHWSGLNLVHVISVWSGN